MNPQGTREEVGLTYLAASSVAVSRARETRRAGGVRWEFTLVASRASWLAGAA